jgi:predicted MPP superfamily phosphohydrolase
LRYILPGKPNKVCSTHLGGEVPNVVLRPGRDGYAHVFLFSDIHVGADSFREDLFLKHLELAKRLKAYILLLGDLTETALPSHIESSVWEQVVTPASQVSKVIEYFSPFRDRIIMMISGNHDLRIWKKTSIDICEYISAELGCFYNRHGGYVLLNVGDQVYRFAIFHGRSAAQNPYHELEKRLTVYDDVDVLAMGNNHFLGEKLVVKKRVIDGKEQRKLIHLVRTGSFISEPDYSRASLYPPTPDGAPYVSLNSNRHQVLVDAHGELRFQ